MKKKLKEKGLPNEDLGGVTIHFAGSMYEGNFVRDLHINEARINEMLIDQPARFAFWADVAAKVQFNYEKKKLELEIFEAKLGGLIRARMEREPGGRVTDSSVQMEVKRHPQRVEKAEALLKLKYQTERLNAIKFAFIQRKDMLMSLGAMLREELGETSLRIREKKFLEDRLLDTAKGRKSD